MQLSSFRNAIWHRASTRVAARDCKDLGVSIYLGRVSIKRPAESPRSIFPAKIGSPKRILLSGLANATGKRTRGSNLLTAGCHDEDASLRVGIEGGESGFHKMCLCFHIDSETHVPILDSGSVEVGEG